MFWHITVCWDSSKSSGIEAQKSRLEAEIVAEQPTGMSEASGGFKAQQ